MSTIKDVARLAGVGVGTASRVISGKGSFSEAAAQRVEAAAAQLGFRPSAIARALSLRSTGTIGIFVPDFKGPFYGPLLDTIDAELRRHDRHMVAANGCGDEDTRQQSLDGARFLIDRECDGIILCSNALREADFLHLRAAFPNIAVVNRDIKGMKSQCFTVDHKAAGRIAAEALLDHGHRRIAVISGPATAGDNRQRLQGLYERLAEEGIATDAMLVEEGDFSPPSGWAAAEAPDRAQARHHRPLLRQRPDGHGRAQLPAAPRHRGAEEVVGDGLRRCRRRGLPLAAADERPHPDRRDGAQRVPHAAEHEARLGARGVAQVRADGGDARLAGAGAELRRAAARVVKARDAHGSGVDARRRPATFRDGDRRDPRNPGLAGSVMSLGIRRIVAGTRMSFPSRVA